jgi:hypothetical protein
MYDSTWENMNFSNKISWGWAPVYFNFFLFFVGYTVIFDSLNNGKNLEFYVFFLLSRICLKSNGKNIEYKQSNW